MHDHFTYEPVDYRIVWGCPTRHIRTHVLHVAENIASRKFFLEVSMNYRLETNDAASPW